MQNIPDPDSINKDENINSDKKIEEVLARKYGKSSFQL